MNFIKSVIKKVAERAKNITLIGAAIVGISMMSFTTTNKVEPIKEKAQLESVKVDVGALVDAIRHANAVHLLGLHGVKGEKAIGIPQIAASQEQYVFFSTNSDTDCDQINLNQYMGPTTPPTVPEGQNPNGCEGEGRCCGKAYPAANVQYNPVNDRWEPTSETGVLYFERSI